MRVVRGISALFLAVAFSACYHATIDTGLTPSGTTITKEWAHGFVYGLVPPAVVETLAKCPHGAAKVETQLSFLNQVASALTLGIYSPMTIQVQCAAAPKSASTVTVPRGASAADFTRAVQKAVDLSVRTGEPSSIELE